jgi:hypothetical protein
MESTLSNEQTALPTEVAGVRIAHTTRAIAAAEAVHASLPEVVTGHASRVFVFASLAARRDAFACDPDMLSSQPCTRIDVRHGGRRRAGAPRSGLLPHELLRAGSRLAIGGLMAARLRQSNEQAEAMKLQQVAYGTSGVAREE